MKAAQASKKSARKTVAKKTSGKQTSAKKRSSSASAAKTSGSNSAGKSSVSHPIVEACRELAELVEDHGLSELIVETEIGHITMRRGIGSLAQAAPQLAAPQLTLAASPLVQAAAPAPVAAAPAGEEAADDGLHKVTSPFVGTFYRAPNPDADPYIELGARVSKGQTLCIVEAMKLMNEIEADVDGVVREIVAANAEPVEYGQVLFKIEAA